MWNVEATHEALTLYIICSMQYVYAISKKIGGTERTEKSMIKGQPENALPLGKMKRKKKKQKNKRRENICQGKIFLEFSHEIDFFFLDNNNNQIGNVMGLR